jgi:hypothetical protein
VLAVAALVGGGNLALAFGVDYERERYGRVLTEMWSAPLVINRNASDATARDYRLAPSDQSGALLGGSLSSVTYRLTSDGTNVSAYEKTGASVSTSADGATVMAAVLPLLPSRTTPVTVTIRNDGNVFPWSSSRSPPILR